MTNTGKCVYSIVKAKMNMSEKEAIKKIRELKEKYTLHELVTMLDVQQTTLHRWLKTGKISKNMSDLLERRIKEANL